MGRGDSKVMDCTNGSSSGNKGAARALVVLQNSPETTVEAAVMLSSNCGLYAGKTLLFLILAGILEYKGYKQTNMRFFFLDISGDVMGSF